MTKMLCVESSLVNGSTDGSSMYPQKVRAKFEESYLLELYCNLSARIFEAVSPPTQRCEAEG